MQLKDYYTTLGIPASASLEQVKKSFRVLAHRYHPDKNPGSAVAEASFKEIHEAYEILSDPEKREEYNYKRWYNRTIKEPFVKEAITPAAILDQCMHLYKYLQTVNALRINFDGLSYHIRQLLNEQNIAILQQGNDEKVNLAIIEKLVAPASLLPISYIGPIADLLLRIAGNNTGQIAIVAMFVKKQQQADAWHRYRTVLVVFVTLLICIVIYFISR